MYEYSVKFLICVGFSLFFAGSQTAKDKVAYQTQSWDSFVWWMLQ